MDSKLILQTLTYFLKRSGETVYPSDVSEALNIPYAEALELVQELEASNAINEVGRPYESN